MCLPYTNEIIKFEELNIEQVILSKWGGKGLERGVVLCIMNEWKSESLGNKWKDEAKRRKTTTKCIPADLMNLKHKSKILEGIPSGKILSWTTRNNFINSLLSFSFSVYCL